MTTTHACMSSTASLLAVEGEDMQGDSKPSKPLMCVRVCINAVLCFICVVFRFVTLAT